MDEGDGWDWAEADGAANAGFEGSIGLEAEISLNVKFSTAACNQMECMVVKPDNGQVIASLCRNESRDAISKTKP